MGTLARRWRKGHFLALGSNLRLLFCAVGYGTLGALEPTRASAAATGDYNQTLLGGTPNIYTRYRPPE